MIIKNKNTFLLVTLLLILTPFQIESHTYVKERSLVETYAYDYEWRYKIVNNVLYRRLLNVTTNQWVGEWTVVEYRLV